MVSSFTALQPTDGQEATQAANLPAPPAMGTTAGYDPLPSHDSFDVLGIPVSATNLRSATLAIREWAGDSIGRFVCVRDVHGIMLAQDDAQLMTIHSEAAMVVPDGMPLVWIGRSRGLNVERTSGPDLFEDVMRNTMDGKQRHFLYGGMDGVAELLARVLRDKYPGVSIVAAETPPFRDLSDDEVAELAARVRSASADIVWVGLPTPQPEFLMQRLVGLVPTTLVGVGAAFDFQSGLKRRAPKWMQ